MRRSLIPLTAALTLLATSAFAGGLGDMTDAERTAFRAEVKQYLLDNPEVLLDAQQVLQDRQDKAATAQDQAALAANADALFKDPNSWAGGNLDGTITVVEFMDYRCPYCRKAFAEVEDLIKSDGKIRFVLKEFPILGADSVASARFAIAVRMLHGDAAYKNAHDTLIALNGPADAAALTRLAAALGFAAKPILDLMPDARITAILTANQALATTLNITGTPTFVIDQTMLRGYVPEAGMKQVVADQRAD